jgi:hypothetical protein
MSKNYYIFRQNNSGGRFSTPAIIFAIQASNATEANSLAKEHGVYFSAAADNYEYGRDCPCCGSRWDSFDRTGERKPRPFSSLAGKFTRSAMVAQ